MPLEAYIDESMALLKAHRSAAGVCVEQVKLPRNAEASGRCDRVFGMLNGAH